MVQISKQQSNGQKLSAFLKKQHVILLSTISLAIFYVLFDDFVTTEKSAAATTHSATASEAIKKIPMSYKIPLAYGTRGEAETTEKWVYQAIQNGFRHIVTGSHHQSHNDTAAGVAWKRAASDDPSITRSDLYLQTMFTPWGTNDFRARPGDPEGTPGIEEQVHITIKQSLDNLQTDYIDAVLFNNFRAKLHPYDEMIKAWRVLEDYVSKGVVRYLGLTSVHDGDYLKRLYDEANVKPVILQNRFHSNRKFDANLHATFQNYNIQVQRFWVLSGNSGGRANADMAKDKGVTQEQLMLAFIMSLGETALVGTHSKQHIDDDLDMMKRFKEIFKDMEGEDQDRKTFADKIRMQYPFQLLRRALQIH